MEHRGYWNSFHVRGVVFRGVVFVEQNCEQSFCFQLWVIHLFFVCHVQGLGFKAILYTIHRRFLFLPVDVNGTSDKMQLSKLKDIFRYDIILFQHIDMITVNFDTRHYPPQSLYEDTSSSNFQASIFRGVTINNSWVQKAPENPPAWNASNLEVPERNPTKMTNLLNDLLNGFVDVPNF